MSPELKAHLAHIDGGTIHPDTCWFCARTWFYRTPAQRLAYAVRKFHFGRGARDAA